MSIAYYINGSNGRTNGNLLEHELDHKASPPPIC